MPELIHGKAGRALPGFFKTKYMVKQSAINAPTIEAIDCNKPNSFKTETEKTKGIAKSPPPSW